MIVLIRSIIAFDGAIGDRAIGGWGCVWEDRGFEFARDGNFAGGEGEEERVSVATAS